MTIRAKMQAGLVRAFLAAMAAGWLLALPAMAKDEPPSRTIASFESDDDFKTIAVSADATSERVKEHATAGEMALKLKINKGEYTGFRLKDAKALAGWDKYRYFRMDVFNAGTKASLEIRIDDDKSTNDYYSYYTGRFELLPGDNPIEIDLTKLVAQGKRKLDPARLTAFLLWVNPIGSTVFVDNLRLDSAQSGSLEGALQGFDFGPAGAAVMPGFKSVDPKTVYTDAAGYGLAPGQYIEGREDAARAVTPLGKDSVTGFAPKGLVFQVKLKPGKYRLWACTGWTGAYNWPRAPYKVSAGGKVIFEHKPATADPVQAADFVGQDYSRKASVWDLFIGGELFDDWQADVTVEAGTLDLAMESTTECRLRGLMIWPADDAAAAACVKKVLEQRRKQFAAAWREDAPPAKKFEKFQNDEETARGFFLVQPSAMYPITPYYYPGNQDLRLAKLSMSAAPGQYEPATFVIHPLADGEATVTVSDMEGPGGKIAAKDIQVNYVHFRYCMSQALGGASGTYSVQPGHLVPLGTLKMEAGVPRQFWLIVHVPADAKAGKYAGSVKVEIGGKTASVPLEAEIYPFRLDSLIDHGITYAHVTSVYEDAKRMEADLLAYSQHGCNSVTPGGAIGYEVKREGGKLVFVFHRLDQLMELMKKVGMTGPVPLFDMSIQGAGGGLSYPHMGFVHAFKYTVQSQEYMDDLTELTRQILARAKEKGYLPVIMYPSTEISNDPEAAGPKLNSKLIAAIRKAGKVECISSVNRPEDLATAAELDHIMINYGVGMTQDAIDGIRKAGAKLWFQNIGQTRYTDGLMMLRCGAVGRRQWVGTWYEGDPYNDWDGPETPHTMLYPSRLGSLPAVQFEWMRAGMYDLRYFLTLRRLIDQGMNSKDALQAAAQAAKKDYDAMLASCPVALPPDAQIQPDGLSSSWGFADRGTFDQYRAKAAEHLTNLWALTQK